MKLEVSSNIQQTKTELDEKFFTIGDPAFVFDLLRNKIYSNPISAVCREITCNALDAHREAGKGDVPIEITLPTYDDLFFKVKDYGPGISPDRMDNIFLNYGASTKRDTNNQIGGFGLGAKSPFAYSDSFTIVTNYNGKRYNYCAFIDDSKIGKLILLDETDTTESNGTEIIIPVKGHEISTFASWVEHSTRHWTVKPKFTGAHTKLSYRTPSPTISGTGWFAAPSTDSYSYGKKVLAIVGEIEYPLDTNALRTYCDTGIMSAIHNDIYFKFNVGDVSLAANRESVYLDAATKEAIKKKFEKVSEEFKEMINQKVENMPSLWEANQFVAHELSSLCANVTSIGTLTWRDIPIKGWLNGGDEFQVIEFHKRQRHDGSFKLNKHTTNSLRFNKHSMLVIHDCGKDEPNPKHVKKFFEENTAITSLCVIAPRNEVDLDELIESHHLDLMNPEYLSKHNSDVKSTKSGITRTVVYQLNSHQFNMVSAKELNDNPKQKVVCYLRKNSYRNTKDAYRDDKITYVGGDALKALLKLRPEVSIYGVDAETSPEKMKKLFKDYITIDKLIEQTVLSNSKEYYLELFWAEKQVNSVSSKFINYIAPAVVKKISNPENLLTKLVEMQAKANEIVDTRKGARSICRSLQVNPVTNEEVEKYLDDNRHNDLVHYWEKIKETYPLIKLANHTYELDSYIGAYADYINTIDQKSK